MGAPTGGQEPEALLARLSASKDAGRLKKHIPTLGESVSRVREVEKAVRQRAEGAGQDLLTPVEAKLASALHHVALSFGSVKDVFADLSTESQGLVRDLFDWMLQRIVGLITRFKEKLQIDSWSIEGSLGFPLGGSVAITVTFKGI
ncbi:MAG: hypothetical protein JRN39_01270 [Nitrososphaerota archaeon]|nr:hypothetical protein [Nitrososphaerota archaeon]